MNKYAYLLIEAVVAWHDIIHHEYIQFGNVYFHVPHKILIQLNSQAIQHHLPEDILELSST